jgi:putative endonuclease
MNPGLGMKPVRRAVSVGAPTDRDGMWTRAEIGTLGEQIAVAHLESLGLRVVERNWRCRWGELDVVAVDDDRVLVFVEVKARTTDRFGGVAQAVTPQKLRRLRRLAGLWLAAHDGRWSVVRIDVIGVQFGRTREPQIIHLQGVA